MLTLADGRSSVVIVPEAGGSLLGWLRDGQPMLRRALPQAVTGDPHAMACFPLLPYANRIAGARFQWQGTAHRLRRNFGDSQHSIHGIGWQRPWQVERVTRRSVALSLRHAADDAWPFAFAAELSYALLGDGLQIDIAVTNRHPGPAPAGIGLHPFFPKAAGAALRFNATGAWQNGDDALPSHHGPVPPEWSHATPLPVGQVRRDNCFTGWDGAADIALGATNLRMLASGALGFLQVFTPDWADFFCVEPVSHPPDGINRDAMHALPPGGRLSGTVRIAATG